MIFQLKIIQLLGLFFVLNMHPVHVSITNMEYFNNEKLLQFSTKIFKDDFQLLFVHLNEINIDFENMYKGEISKSGTPILPSKRARKIPEKIQVAPEDLEELTAKAEPEVEVNPELEVASEDTETASEETEVSLDQIAEAETEAETTEVNSDDSETTNS